MLAQSQAHTLMALAVVKLDALRRDDAAVLVR
jgi:hypothetical protein